MRGLIWKCRGVGIKGMATCLSDLISDHSLDFLGPQETMKKNFSSKCMRKLDPFNTFEWVWIPSCGKSGGIIAGARKDILDLSSNKKGKFMI